MILPSGRKWSHRTSSTLTSDKKQYHKNLLPPSIVGRSVAVATHYLCVTNAARRRQIIAGGAAARTGRLRVGDRLLAVNGKDVRSASHEQVVMALLEPSMQMTLRVRHDPLPAGWQVRSHKGHCLPRREWERVIC